MKFSIGLSSAFLGLVWVASVSAGVVLDKTEAANAPRNSLAVAGRGSASAEYTDDKDPAMRVFDGSIYTSWKTRIPAGKTGWLEFHFDEDVSWVATEYAVANGATAEAWDPREWELLGSRDGKTWDKLDTRKRQIFISRRRTNTYRLRTTVAYNRYRLVLVSNGDDTPVELSEVGFTVKAAAQPPDTIAGEQERGEIRVAWSPVESATGYTVRRAGDPRGPYIIRVSGLQGTTYVDRGPFDEGELSYYTVSTDIGGPQGVMSLPASVVTPVGEPTGLKAKIGEGQVVLEWSPSPKAVAYVVRRSLLKEGPYTVVGSLITAPGFTDKGLSAGTAYYYVVCGVANGKEGVDTAPVAALFTPLTPTGLVLEPGKDKVTLRWDAVTLAKSYRILRSTGDEGIFFEVAVVRDATTWSDESATHSKVCHYKVAAENECGVSAESAPVSGSPIRPAAWWRR